MCNPLLGVGVLVVVAAACGGTRAADGPTTSSTTVPVGAAACPRQWVHSSNSSLNPPPARPGLANTLVPPGPTFLTVCRYAGLNQAVTAGTLVQSHVLTGSQLPAFVTYIDQPTWQVIPKGAVYSCPASQGRVDLLQFVYPSGPGVKVSVDIDGCRFVSNGSRTVSGGAIGTRLTAWVGIDG